MSLLTRACTLHRKLLHGWKGWDATHEQPAHWGSRSCSGIKNERRGSGSPSTSNLSAQAGSTRYKCCGCTTQTPQYRMKPKKGERGVELCSWRGQPSSTTRQAHPIWVCQPRPSGRALRSPMRAPRSDSTKEKRIYTRPIMLQNGPCGYGTHGRSRMTHTLACTTERPRESAHSTSSSCYCPRRAL